MKESVIQFENYGFKYNAQAEPTLTDVNITIRSGEKILIAGPSGSGKSTLGCCINALIPERYNGEHMGSLRLYGKTPHGGIFVRSKLVGTVLQDPDAQFIGLTVGEDIAFSLENSCIVQEEMKTAVAGAAELVGAGGFLDHRPHALSGGQKQRVSLAGVLIDKVGVLLFDEPLANLDPAAGRRAIALIDDIQRETGVTVIIIEHRLEDVLFRAVDRIILINEGHVAADMPPDELLAGGLLEFYGIREPLYLTALKYAGVTPERSMCLSSIDTLKLCDDDAGRVVTWYRETHPPSAQKREEPLIEVSGLSFAYTPGRDVLRGVSFTVNRGEMLAIAGTNGAGKSTLSKLICGFIKPSAGMISYEGRDMISDSITERARKIGYVMQNPNQMISKPMIFDEVALGLRNSGLSAEDLRVRVEDTLRVCGLYPFRNWPISALSFGQKKRVTIASILALNPEVLILDEPTAGQDFRHYSDIMAFLRQLNARGVTVIMITHDMHLMLEYAPRALVFSEGCLIADDSTARILSDADICRRGSLKETSLHTLADMLKLNPPDFVQHFIDYDRAARQSERGAGGD